MHLISALHTFNMPLHVMISAKQVSLAYIYYLLIYTYISMHAGYLYLLSSQRLVLLLLFRSYDYVLKWVVKVKVEAQSTK